MPVFYCLPDITIYWSKIYVLYCFYAPNSWLKPLLKGFPWTYCMKVGTKKLESMGYLLVKTAWFCEHLSLHGTGL